MSVPRDPDCAPTGMRKASLLRSGAGGIYLCEGTAVRCLGSLRAVWLGVGGGLLRASFTTCVV